MAKNKKETKSAVAPSKPPVKKKANNWLLAIACAVVISVITWFVFSPSIKNDFTNWDDPTYVNDNPLVINNKVPVQEIFSIKHPVSLNYHPLTILSLALNYQSDKQKRERMQAGELTGDNLKYQPGLNPEGYHLVNVILHVLNTFLVFLFIFLLTGRNVLMASFVALFFGIHPMHVESVSWVSERKDVLYVFFFLAGLITYLLFKQSRNWLLYMITLLLFTASCLSKGMAVVFPVILLLIDYLQNVKWKLGVFLEKIPFFIVSITLGLIAFKIQQGVAIADIKVFSIFQRIMFASYGAIEYVVKLFIPVKLSGFYPYPSIPIPLIFYLSPFIILAFTALVFFFLRKQKAIIFGLLFYIVSVALVLQFISVGSAIMADRYSYLAYIGLFFALAWLLNEAWQTKNEMLGYLKFPLTAVALMAALIFSNQTYARTKIWKTTATFWKDVVTNNPNVETAWKNLGNYYGKELNKPDSAMLCYRVLVKMHSRDTKVYSNLGNVYGLRNQADSALWAYSEAIKLDPMNTDAYINRAVTYCRGQQYEKALPDFDKALNIDHNLYSVYSSRGYTYLVTGKYQESINDYNLYIQIDPGDAQAYYYRGLAEKALSRTDAYNKDVQQAKALGFKVPEGG